jgi:hypothetical protein
MGRVLDKHCHQALVDVLPGKAIIIIFGEPENSWETSRPLYHTETPGSALLHVTGLQSCDGSEPTRQTDPKGERASLMICQTGHRAFHGSSGGWRRH